MLVCSIILLFEMAYTQPEPVDEFPVNAFAIAAPSPTNLDSFIRFINTELAPRNINTLILWIDFNYRYTSHPELVSSNPLSYEDVSKLKAACKAKQIAIIPLINLLGHQSWAGNTGKLLEVYPQFDETPWVKMPAAYKWPNADSLYCKSYCPLHPEVHKIVFDLVDEICDAFDATAFHAGMDEVFYIGMDKCPRCGGRDKASLFAGEVKTIRDHLALKNRKLWIWGDRLLDGHTTGLGMWEASFNNTHPAIDLIPKDVVICDWHYDRADKTAVYFAVKGFRVITCTWNNPQVAAKQLKDMQNFRITATPEMKSRYLGMMQTVWASTDAFLNEFYKSETDTTRRRNNTSSNAFRAAFPVNIRSTE